MTIDAIKNYFPPISDIKIPTETPRPKADGAPSVNFGEMLTNSIKEVSSLQGQADQKIQDLVLHRGDTTTHDAMIALEKADVAFQLMSTIRSKIIQAYQEVMRTQV